ncbi:hypothetical protein P153DRAFT_433722 [Dothidotthia symphoricarpi CBS 119687]|uniref:Uncharacterized protein n=1 Tax=Dothidotthia symphoricarpi CBS 119687 TaxID=1392245 RepID=A0A6A6A3L1_9PLEO|nr:uncharacterized protein P153DRAFT_433722 [Dothidotthia symphoricarpi CBS 119687]KAF2126602.1 hypothetical protein P153DRAFT_433722 [Dothidotthia symphoricarpi CBS 119687]
MSRFERLPQAIRRKILGHLLITERVRQLPNKSLVEDYAFELSVLRLNNAINKDAMNVLYVHNGFVKVNWFFDQAQTALTNHEVPFFKLGNSCVHHIAEITITSDNSFLLVLDDMAKFTRLLRILDFANFMSFHFDFKLRQPPLRSSAPTLVEQEKLLLPFACVRGGAMVQKVTMTGAFNPALEARIKEAMTQKVSWLRGGAWELHDLTLSIKRMGDFAWRIGNADMALAKYDDARNFDKQAWDQNTMMMNVDHKVHEALLRVHCTMWTDIALLMLTDMAMKVMGKRGYEAVPNMTTHIEDAIKSNKRGEIVVPHAIIARFYNILGVAQLGLGHAVKAGGAFATAYKTSPQQLAKDGHQVAKEWRGLSKRAREKRLNLLLAALPKEPLDIPDMQEYLTPEVASEHWVMRKLGHTGPIPYEDKIKPAVAIVMTMKPHPNKASPGPRTARIGEVCPEVLQKHVEKFRKRTNHPLAKGRLICWVALNAGEIDEQSIWDDNSEQASALESMGRNDCAMQ